VDFVLKRTTISCLRYFRVSALAYLTVGLLREYGPLLIALYIYADTHLCLPTAGCKSLKMLLFFIYFSYIAYKEQI